ncbi:MAG TPA: UPF0158 family protein [Nocardioides sp.]
MDDRDALTRLRSLVVRGDGAELVSFLSLEPWPADSLQLLGDGLLAALRDGTDGSAEWALKCAEALRERLWEGDRELVEVLEAVLGEGPTPLLRPVPVDLEELSMVLEGDPVQGGGRIDLATGQVWPEFALDDAEETGEEEDDDPDRWLWVHCEGSRDGYRDMVWFIEELDDPTLADRLARAISGRGAFRRFKDTLFDQPDLVSRWYAFSSDRQRGRARSWLAAEGYTPTPPQA